MISSLKIVVPIRNAESWIGQCINSISAQNYNGRWNCIIIDDASTDGTVEKIKDAIGSIQSTEIRNKFEVKFNSKRVGALENFIFGFKQLCAEQEPESVLIQIDGDDWLFSDVVFQIIEQAYTQTGCWMTWGNYIEWPLGVLGMAKPMPNEWHVNKSYRSQPWVMSHLRTFKSHLWHSIKDEDLRDMNGNYYDVTWDLAHMFPMIEMAQERSCFIPYVLYCYNRNNPLSDDKIYRERQLRFESEIRSKKQYDRKIL
jgi:glycosyltransferase involved in cell wall biosynthesis